MRKIFALLLVCLFIVVGCSINNGESSGSTSSSSKAQPNTFRMDLWEFVAEFEPLTEEKDRLLMVKGDFYEENVEEMKNGDEKNFIV